jgi:hypothetical protein
MTVFQEEKNIVKVKNQVLSNMAKKRDTRSPGIKIASLQFLYLGVFTSQKLHQTLKQRRP